MDVQTIINGLFAICGALIGWIAYSVKESVKDLQTADKALTEKVQEIELLVVGDYVKHSDFKEFSTAIFAKLDRMETKMDSKADKSK